MSEWIRTYESDDEFVEHRGGVDWYHAPKPPRHHPCRAQTRAFMDGDFVERCACGAIRLDGKSPWMERNS